MSPLFSRAEGRRLSPKSIFTVSSGLAEAKQRCNLTIRQRITGRSSAGGGLKRDKARPNPEKRNLRDNLTIPVRSDIHLLTAGKGSRRRIMSFKPKQICPWPNLHEILDAMACPESPKRVLHRIAGFLILACLATLA